MDYFIISKFDLSNFLRFGYNRVFLKIAERRGAIIIQTIISGINIRVRRSRVRAIFRAPASNTDMETLTDIGIRNKIVGKTNGRTAAYLCGYTA